MSINGLTVHVAQKEKLQHFNEVARLDSFPSLISLIWLAWVRSWETPYIPGASDTTHKKHTLFNQIPSIFDQVDWLKTS